MHGDVRREISNETLNGTKLGVAYLGGILHLKRTNQKNGYGQ